MIKINKGDLLSYPDINLGFGWKVRKPRLSEIAEISFPVFSYYQTLVTLTVDGFLNVFANEQFRTAFKKLPDKDRNNVTLYSFITRFHDMAQEFCNLLNFFSTYDVSYVEGIFFQTNGKNDDGSDIIVGAIINEEQFEIVRDTIRLICGLVEKEEEKPKFEKKQSKIGNEIWKKLQKGSKKLEDAKGINRNFELPNIISALAVKDNSLNLITIWDLTIYQLMETFDRFRNNIVFDISARSVSIWGDEKGQFNPDGWFKNNEDE